MSALTVRRWRRYGHDRLYVSLPDGTRAGWVDLRTGESVVERAEFRHDFDRAVHA